MEINPTFEEYEIDSIKCDFHKANNLDEITKITKKHLDKISERYKKEMDKLIEEEFRLVSRLMFEFYKRKKELH